MIYFVEGLPQRKLTYDQLDEILLVADDVLRLPSDLAVEITFVSDTPYPWCGDADVEDGVALLTINKRIHKREMIITILHEMVHVKQIVDGRLSIGEGRMKSTWDGQHFDLTYEDLPWEQEAFQLEQYMMKILEEKTDGLYRKSR